MERTSSSMCFRMSKLGPGARQAACFASALSVHYGTQTNRTPIWVFLRQTTVQSRAADSISRTRAKASGVPFGFGTSIKAPVAEILQTVQVILSLAKLILPALKISRRGGLRFSPGAAPVGPERAGA